MNRIPKEILCEIFTFLHQNDQLECMLVCHFWKQNLEQFSLFHSVYLSCTENMEKLTTKIQENPRIGQRVENLVFYSVVAYSDKLNAFLSLLENVRTITCIDVAQRSPNIGKPIDFSFRKHLEYISSISYKSRILGLLSSGVFFKLTSLKAWNHYGNIIPLLKNTPSLMQLTLESGDYSFDDFNRIHENAPKLISIELNNFSIVSNDNNGILTGDTSNTIPPATPIKECIFLFSSLECRLRQNRFLEYIRIKYPSLTRLTCHFNAFNASYNSKLAYLDWIPLLQTTGPQLKKLGARQLDCSSIFSELDQYGVQLEHLEFTLLHSTSLNNMIHSKQVYTLQSLEIGCDRFNRYKWLKCLRSLKELVLSSHSGHVKKCVISLNELVCNCPDTLLSLTIKNADLDYQLGDTFTSTRIKHLSFYCIKLFEGIDTFISRYFPDLSRLTLNECVLKEKKIEISNAHLNHFCLHQCFSTKTTCTLLIATATEKRLYTAKYQSIVDSAINNPFTPYPTSIPVVNEFDIRHFTLVCHSLKTVTFTATFPVIKAFE